ncbi:MAG: AAA family ATPase [Planctomycetaceae bacterium]|nr:AAA family ATPase [Planctomycetaceae bacterium]
MINDRADADDMLRALALMDVPDPVTTRNGHAPAIQHTNGHAGENHRLDVPKWLGDCGVEFKVKELSDRKVYTITCPDNPEHVGDANITQHASGALSASCFHNGCAGKGWAEFRVAIGPRKPEHFDPPITRAYNANAGNATTQPTPTVSKPLPKIITAGQLIADNPRLRRGVIEGVLRLGETINLISKSKVGKSWFVYLLLFCVAMGWKWFGRFQCIAGPVLLIDNELHAETLANRLKTVAEALQLQPEDWQDRIHVLSLRGRLLDINALGLVFRTIHPGTFSLIVVDALYRAQPTGFDENGQNATTAVYNAIDSYGMDLEAAFGVVVHATKGDQSGKDVVDVGSGAGAMARATDVHLVLRPHTEEGHVVLDAAIRSWEPIEPVVLKWNFPLWEPVDGLDPTALKQAPTKTDQRQATKDAEGFDEIIAALREHGRGTASKLRGWTGQGRGRFTRLAAVMVKDGRLLTETVTEWGNECDEYRLAAYLATGHFPNQEGVVCGVSDNHPDNQTT